jgi:hypothetical protein
MQTGSKKYFFEKFYFYPILCYIVWQKFNRRFGGTYRHHLQGPSVCQAMGKKQAASKALLAA